MIEPILNQLNDLKTLQSIEVSRQLTKVQAILLATEDLVRAVEKMELPANLFFESQSVRDVTQSSGALKTILKLWTTTTHLLATSLVQIQEKSPASKNSLAGA